MNYPYRGFDESTYMKSNPDVLAAVQKRTFSSGWDHFMLYGFYENRSGVPVEVYEAMRSIIEDSGAFPPQHLRERVHGGKSLDGFKKVGKSAAIDIYSSINSAIKLGDHQHILDFGCGCGRITRYLHKLYSNCTFFGTDIDEEAILWCQQQLSQIGMFTKNGESPPLPFEDQYFDIIYSISIFTHLPENMQFDWLEELRRVTKPGGYLLLTTQSRVNFKTLSAMSEESKMQYQNKGFYYVKGAGTAGLPDFYQQSYHTKDYIHANWSKYFEIKQIKERGLANHQDLVLCIRPSP
jgi:ubiquinone/menaquinone biosynthesis C-methylase UbiE